jgi:hypothetical protein
VAMKMMVNVVSVMDEQAADAGLYLNVFSRELVASDVDH